MGDNFVHRGSFLAGELAGAAGVSTDTLRHYERMGVLPRPARAANGYRHYPETALERVLMVRRALAVGFTLDELASILNERDNGGAPCRKVRELVGQKLSFVEEQLEALAELRDELSGIVSDWDWRLGDTGLNARADLLKNLALKNEHAKLPSSLKFKKRKPKK